MKTLPHISISVFVSLINVANLFATNGMNLEGYGPVSLGMGGAAIASDYTTAAVMNNPATLILQDKQTQFDFAIGVLGPNVSTVSPGGHKANSSGDAYFMPALGYTWKKDNLVIGMGLFGQGGMGTKYSSESFLGAGSGLGIHSCVSVGRFIVPIAYRVNEKLTVSASFDFVWAGMNLKMPMSGAQFEDMTTPGMQHGGQASGTLLNAMMPFMMAGYQLDWAHFDFSTDSQFYGEALGTGFAGKLGLLYEVNEKLTIGATYHAKTSLSHLSTDNATMRFQLSSDMPPPGYPPVFPAAVKGDLDVVDFEWPTIYGVGINYQVNDRWRIVADIKNILWADVMDNFTMNIVVNSDASNDMSSMGGPNMQGQNLSAQLYQNWDDQLVIAIGAEYQATEDWTVRFGCNHGKNPIPAQYTNPLFPATVENHLTGGFSYQTGGKGRIDFAMVIGLEESVKIPVGGGMFMTSTHSQINAQLSYNMSW